MERPLTIFRFGPYELRPRTRELYKQGIKLKLRPQPFQVLNVLVERPGDVVTRDELRQLLWSSETFVDFEHGLNTSIKELRGVLSDSASEPRYIETLPRLGYRIMVPVKVVEADPEKEGASAPRQSPISGNLSGKKVSHYRVLQLLGGGGMGVVYKAEDLKLGRQVTIKFLPGELASDPVAFERLQREARAASSLDHPNICSIYELGEHEGQPFIVMQLLEGQTLREWIESAARESTNSRLNKLLDLAVQITDGLDAAHHKGIIHRDIKPANIFITGRGEAKILDFGVAKFVDAGESPDGSPTVDGTAGSAQRKQIVAFPDSNLTKTGLSMGTPSYLSPEQVRREKLDARTDIFSFGAVLYEMTTGTLPFRGDTSEIIFESILNRAPTPAVRLNPNLPAELERIIAEALEKDRNLRYQNAADLRTDLKRLKRATELGDNTGFVATPAPVKKVRHWLLLPSMAVLALILVGIFVVAPRWRHAELKRNPVQRDLTANPPENPVVAYTISKDGKYFAYADRAKGLALLQIDTGESRSFPNTASLRPLEWFPDGNHLLVLRTDGPMTGELWKMSTWDGTTHKLLDAARSASLSPDGTRIAYGNASPMTDIWLMGTDGENPRRMFSAGPGSEYHAFDWSPTGQRIMYLQAKGSTDKSPEIKIETCNLDGGQCTMVFSDRRLHSSNGFSVATWLADGRILFTLPEPPPNENDTNIWAIEVDPNTGQIRGKSSRVTNWTGFSMDGFSHSAEGKRLVFMKTQQRNVVKIAEIRAKDEKVETPRRLNEDSWNSLAGAWTTDSQNILTVSNRSGKWGVYKQNLLEHDSHALIAGSGNYSGPAISPDGKWLFYSESTGLDYSDASTRLMRMSIEGGPASVVLPGRHHYSCSRSPANVCVVSELKGKDLVFSFLEPIKGLGRQIARVGITRDYYDLSLSPDGKSIALVAEQEKIIRIVSTENGSVHSVSLKDWTWLQSVTWYTDCSRVYVNGRLGGSWGILSVDLAGNVKVLVRALGGTAWVHGPIVSPDGHHLAYDERDFVSSVTMLENF